MLLHNFSSPDNKDSSPLWCHNSGVTLSPGCHVSQWGYPRGRGWGEQITSLRTWQTAVALHPPCHRNRRRRSSSRVQENTTPIRPRRPGSCSIASAPPGWPLHSARDTLVGTREMNPSSVQTHCSHRKIRNEAPEFCNLLPPAH